nr:F495 [uncultured bacterium]
MEAGHDRPSPPPMVFEAIVYVLQARKYLGGFALGDIQ